MTDVVSGQPTDPGRLDGLDDRALDSQRRAYDKVRQLILTGKLTPGAWVSQVQLASQLELSRTPLREALRRLATEGLVQLDFNRQLRVAPLSIDDLESLYALRIVAEPLAIRLSIPRLTDADLGVAAEALRKEQAAADRGDEEGVYEHHRIFHFTLIGAAEERVRAHVENLWDHAVRYVRVYHSSPSLRLSLILMSHTEHDMLLDAAMARNKELAARLTAEHLARTALTVIAAVAGGHDPSTIRESLRFVLDAAPSRPGDDQ